MDKFYVFNLDRVSATEEEIENFLTEIEGNKDIFHNGSGYIFTRNINKILGEEQRQEQNTFTAYITWFNGGEYYNLGTEEIQIRECIDKLIEKINNNDKYVIDKINENFTEEKFETGISQLIKEQLTECIDDAIKELNQLKIKVKEGNFEWK